MTAWTWDEMQRLYGLYQLERATFPDESEEEYCERLFREHSPDAMTSLRDLASNAHDPNIRRQASTYVEYVQAKIALMVAECRLAQEQNEKGHDGEGRI